MIKSNHIKFAILLPIAVFSQNKTIVPKSGTIVFESKNSITDEKLYKEFFNDFKAYITSALKEEMIKIDAMTGETVSKKFMDKVLENTFNAFYPLNDKTRTYKYFQEFDDTIIYHYKTLNDRLMQEIAIDVKTGLTDDIFEDYVYYSHDEVTEIKEFPEEIKIINGYECFKVVYFLKENRSAIFDHSGYIDYRELWVTDKIKCAYHPVIHDKIILEKYYPLEINEYFNVLKGYVKKYELIKLEIE